MRDAQAAPNRHARHAIPLLALLVIAAMAAVAAREAAGSTRQSLERFCFECHAGDVREGGLDLRELLAVRPVVRERTEWRRVAQVVELRSMPPEWADQPSAAERERIAASITRTLDRFDYQSVASPGYEATRRLTHREYNNTLRDLLGVDLRPADRFPRELAGATGFDNDASTLFLQPALMERYIAAAERVVDAALPAAAGEGPVAAREILLHGNDPATLSDAAASQLLTKFLQRAYRRPASESDLARVTASYQAARDAGATPGEAFKQVLPGVLISPRFLLRHERPPTDGKESAVDDWELATRLSYFLWSTMPDDALFRAAGSGELTATDATGRRDGLRRQVERMVADARFDEFGPAFAGQWLSTRLVGREIRRDPIDEPWCTDSLMDAIRAETEQLLVWLVRNDRPATELLTADYTFATRELAKTLYRIDGVGSGGGGGDLHRVSLVGSGRRGLLGHAAVLAVTSNHDETSPIKRGAYILETLLGCPPPPPPPDVSDLRDDFVDNDRLSLAEKLTRHAADQRCSSCHRQIDPLGIGLERFGAFGRLRSAPSRDGRSRAGRAIAKLEASAVLPTGAKVGGAKALVRYLIRDRRDDFIRNLVERTLQFALGRTLDYRDEQAVRDLAAAWDDAGLGMRELICLIAESPTFRVQHAPTTEPPPDSAEANHEKIAAKP
ncbi:MAG: DUF1592 domain-containing protein [Planctomycetota bacterium]